MSGVETALNIQELSLTRSAAVAATPIGQQGEAPPRATNNTASSQLPKEQQPASDLWTWLENLVLSHTEMAGGREDVLEQASQLAARPCLSLPPAVNPHAHDVLAMDAVENLVGQIGRLKVGGGSPPLCVCFCVLCYV
jgi:hypothetical protein